MACLRRRSRLPTICLVNVHFGAVEQPEWMYRVKNEYFKQEDSIFGRADLGRLLDEMAANGVERAVRTSSFDGPAVRRCTLWISDQTVSDSRLGA